MGLGATLIFPASLSVISYIFTERAERAGPSDGGCAKGEAKR